LTAAAAVAAAAAAFWAFFASVAHCFCSLVQGVGVVAKSVTTPGNHFFAFPVAGAAGPAVDPCTCEHSWNSSFWAHCKMILAHP